MAEVVETHLPGVGVRHEFVSSSGARIGVLSHRSGRREVIVYDRDDPDAGSTVLHLSADDTRTLAELLGTSHVNEAVTAVQHKLEGLAIDWITVAADSPSANATIADGAFRTRTGASIVAIMRDDETVPAPGPEHRLEIGDVVVAVGTPSGLSELRNLIG